MPLKGVEPKPGDLIEIFRFGYQHWALYVGDEYVIHLTSPNEDTKTGSSSLMSDQAVVRKELLLAVVKDDDYCVNNKHDGKLYQWSVDQIIKEAESLVGKMMPYSVISNNCEHFVTKLRYPVARSDQVGNAVTTAIVGTNLAIIGAVGAYAYATRSDKKQEDE